MKNKPLVLKFKNDEHEYLFENKVFVIEDQKLIKNLEKPSIKNSDSRLLIKSLNDLHIADVAQLKINLNETGFFLVSFQKDSLTEEKRTALLEEISSLKSNAAQSNSTQLKKVSKLLEILNKYNPIYSSFINDGDYSVNITKISQQELNFPLLVLSKKQPVKSSKIKANNEVKSPYKKFRLLETDYFFVLAFALLGSFGVITSIFEIMNKQGIAIFLGVLAVAFSFVLILSVQSTLYKKGKLINPLLRYYLILFIIVGVIVGIIAGYFVSKLLLKTEINDFDYKKLLIISSVISLPVMLSSLLTSWLANQIIKKKYEEKRA